MSCLFTTGATVGNDVVGDAEGTGKLQVVAPAGEVKPFVQSAHANSETAPFRFAFMSLPAEHLEHKIDPVVEA